MRTVAIVPIKLNNRRLPQKNTIPFTNGEPLCYYVLSTLLKVQDINDIFVYCSNPEIVAYLPEGIKFLKRSETLDQDTTSINEVLRSFSYQEEADIYILSHATAPFISEKSIQMGLDAVLKKGYDSAFSVKKIQEFLWAQGKPLNFDLSNIPRTQDLPLIYQETSGFYVFRREVIRTLNRRVGLNPFMVEVSEIESVDIDEKEDFMIADAIFNQIIINKT